jgi:hypothetical protein
VLKQGVAAAAALLAGENMMSNDSHTKIFRCRKCGWKCVMSDMCGRAGQQRGNQRYGGSNGLG